MATGKRHRERGQALVMVSIALVAMFGIMGLAVDTGWTFFVRKTAQAAADSAALAAVQAGFAASATGAINCVTLTCTAPVSCPGAGGNLTNGCQYAFQNGFPTSGAQTVTLESDIGANKQPPTAPGVVTEYWVTARVRETIPQLFSAVLGNLTGTSGARATAAILQTAMPGALILLNRQNDCLAMNGKNSSVCGVNLSANGSSEIKAIAGILMASTRNSGDTPCNGTHAGEICGGATVTSDFTGIRGTGNANANDPQWHQQWKNGLSDSDFFKDPMRNLNGQPPAPPSGLSQNPIAGCVIDATGTNPLNGQPYGPNNRLVLTSGKYYSTGTKGNCADGDPIQIKGYIWFAGCAAPPCSTFGNFTFFGGIQAANGADMRFDPGEYVLAGVKPSQNGAGALFDISAGQVHLQDNTPLDATGQSVPNSDAGELFVFTGPDASGQWYPNLDISGVPSGVLSDLEFGTSGFKTGSSNTGVLINLHGLNEGNGALPANLKNYFDPAGDNTGQPVLFWQDQRNSVTRYYDGTVKNMGCITGDSASGCTNTLANADSPVLSILATADTHLYGVIYQPRGSWTELVGGGKYSGPLRIITGAIKFQGSADLDLVNLGAPLMVRTVALVE